MNLSTLVLNLWPAVFYLIYLSSLPIMADILRLPDIHSREVPLSSRALEGIVFKTSVGAHCPGLSIANGRVTIRSRGRTAKFACRSGYQMIGRRFLTCVRGHWNGDLPVCATRGCPDVVLSPHTQKFLTMRGALLRFQCDPGYGMNAWPALFCDGIRWNASAPTCDNLMRNPPLKCDFEQSLCGWSDDKSDNFDWTRFSSSTPSGHIGTGPSHDHTFGTGKDGFYLYIEASSPRKENDKARLYSPVFPVTQLSKDSCFVLWYHMYGSAAGSLNIYLKPESKDFASLSPSWNNSGDQGNQWHLARIPLVDYTESFQVIVEAIRGTGYSSDIAIDDVSIRSGTECEEQTTTMADWSSTEDPMHSTEDLQLMDLSTRFFEMPTENQTLSESSEESALLANTTDSVASYSSAELPATIQPMTDDAAASTMSNMTSLSSFTYPPYSDKTSTRLPSLGTIQPVTDRSISALLPTVTQPGTTVQKSSTATAAAPAIEAVPAISSSPSTKIVPMTKTVTMTSKIPTTMTTTTRPTSTIAIIIPTTTTTTTKPTTLTVKPSTTTTRPTTTSTVKTSTIRPTTTTKGRPTTMTRPATTTRPTTTTATPTTTTRRTITTIKTTTLRPTTTTTPTTTTRRTTTTIKTTTTRPTTITTPRTTTRRTTTTVKTTTTRPTTTTTPTTTTKRTTTATKKTTIRPTNATSPVPTTSSTMPSIPIVTTSPTPIFIPSSSGTTETTDMPNDIATALPAVDFDQINKLPPWVYLNHTDFRAPTATDMDNHLGPSAHQAPNSAEAEVKHMPVPVALAIALATLVSVVVIVFTTKRIYRWHKTKQDNLLEDSDVRYLTHGEVRVELFERN